MTTFAEKADFYGMERCVIEGDDLYHAVVFPSPNGRVAVWCDTTRAVTVYDSLDVAKADVGAQVVSDTGSEEDCEFAMHRYEDVSGRSGTGVPAVGVEFPDGTCAMGWLTDINSVSVYDALHEVQDIHGHGGKTQISRTGGA